MSQNTKVREAGTVVVTVADRRNNASDRELCVDVLAWILLLAAGDS